MLLSLIRHIEILYIPESLLVKKEKTPLSFLALKKSTLKNKEIVLNNQIDFVCVNYAKFKG